MKIYTKGGDKGQTSLFDSHRVDKDDIRVEAYGTIDELNSAIGFAKAHIEDQKNKEKLIKIQKALFSVGGELATRDGSSYHDRISDEDVVELETWIDDYINGLGEQRAFKFILPGTNVESGALHIARTICRRAERRMITLSKEAKVSETLIKYVNRLSDYLFAIARFYENKEEMIELKKRNK